LPSGFGVQQQFYEVKTLKIKPYIYGKDLLNLNTPDKNKYDNSKQLTSLMPNLVHSLDAASLALLISYFFKESNSKNFYSIHDCFSVSCNHIHTIMNLLKVIYLNVYSKDRYLVDFDRDLFTSIIKHYGEHCYNHETKIITIKDKDDKHLELTYPNVHDVIYNDKLNVTESSYIIH
jgi:DNA-directed RNA polymerase